MFLKNKKSLVVINSYILNLFTLLIFFLFVLSIINIVSDTKKELIEYEEYLMESYQIRNSILSSLETINSSSLFVSKKNFEIINNSIQYRTIKRFNSIYLLTEMCDDYLIYKEVKYKAFFNGSCVKLLFN